MTLLVLISCSNTKLSKSNVIDIKENSLYSNDSNYLSLCQYYLNNYCPLYIVDGDSMVASVFNYVPDSLNNYLFECAVKKDYRALKFAAALIIRQHYEYIKVNEEEYIIQDCLIQKNGFIELLRCAMGYDNNRYYGDVDYFMVFTGEVIEWISKNKQQIDDYQFVEMYKKKLN
ncbi:MAG: hypothetical protein JNM67_05465 [Bacteroidetes bacterium]|nr:hypothetical protein [Bacteroidota bacterium]